MITETPIVFPGAEGMLAGIFARNTANFEQRQFGVMVTGSWLTVKEQMPLLYARRLAALGYTTFVFDFSGFGESQGEPRQAEIPERKIRDICTAADFLSTLSFIEFGGVGHVAVCASAQYGQHALARGAQIATFASVAGWYHDAASIAPFYGAAEGVARRMGWAAADVAALLDAGSCTIAPAYAPGDERAGMYFELDYYANPARGAVPEWKNAMAPISWAYWLTFDGLSVAASNRRPSLMVHGPGCALPNNAKRAYERWAGAKRLVWLDGEQTDFYDRPKQVDQAVAAIDDWFKAYLKRGSEKESTAARSPLEGGQSS